LPQAAVGLRHAESTPQEATLEEKKSSIFFSRPIGAGGVGRQEIAGAAGTELWAAVVLAGGRRIEVHPDFDTNTFERLVSALERV
jgi:hypothetical protein